MGIVRNGDRVILDGCDVADWDAMREAYLRRVDRYGTDHRAFFYTDQDLYRRRLERAGQVLAPLLAPEHSVLDVGCGDGKLLEHLPPCRYTGLDLVPEFVAHAAGRFPDRDFHVANIMEWTAPCDWVLLIGTSGTTPCLERMIEHCWGLCRVGMVLDVLDARRDPGGDRNSCHAADVLDFYLERGAARVCVEPTSDPWTFFVARKAV
jgi:SAM-dependent methyltransferase